jgi:hypothetical protein
MNDRQNDARDAEDLPHAIGQRFLPVAREQGLDPSEHLGSLVGVWSPDRSPAVDRDPSRGLPLQRGAQRRYLRDLLPKNRGRGAT